MPKQTDFVTKDHFDKVIREKFDAVMEKLDWLIGKYRAHDEEHTLLNGQVSDHSDRLEKLKER